MKEYLFDGSKELQLKNIPTAPSAEVKAQKAELVQKTAENLARAAELQEMLYAAGEEGLVIAIQARDAAGKDSLIKKVFSGLNPASLRVTSFKAPNGTELKHDFLWRLNNALPARGEIALFNRSHYEDVLVVKVHHMEQGYTLAARCVDGDFFKRRYGHLRSWEEYLYDNGIRMVKVFLNVSQEEQRKRFLDRVELDEKHWKLPTNDLKERALWEEYDEAYEDAVNATATAHSPWYVLPADAKWYTRYLMSQILVDTLEEMDPHYPPLDPAEAAKIPQCLEQLAVERKDK